MLLPEDAEKWGLIFETLLYAVFLLLWILSMRILLDRHRLHRPVPAPVNTRIFIGSCLMFCIITMRWCIDVYRTAHANRLKDPAKSLYLIAYGDAVNVLHQGLILASGWLLDAFLVYRVWVIFEERTWPTLVPGLCLLGTMVTGIGVIVTATQINWSFLVYTTSAYEWVTTCFSLTLVTNVVCTGLIMYRLIQVDRSLRRLGGARTLWPVVLILIESAALYTISAAFMLACFLCRSAAIVTVSNILNPIIGISFSSIIVRVGMGVSPRPFHQGSLPSLPHLTLTTTPVDLEPGRNVPQTNTPDSPSTPFDSRDDLPSGVSSGGGGGTKLKHARYASTDASAHSETDAPDVRTVFFPPHPPLPTSSPPAAILPQRPRSSSSVGEISPLAIHLKTGT